MTDDLDPAMATLIADLKERGMLDDNAGHLDWAISVALHTSANKEAATIIRVPGTSLLAGGGIKSGQVIGNTDKEGRHSRKWQSRRRRFHGHRLQGARHQLRQTSIRRRQQADAGCG